MLLMIDNYDSFTYNLVQYFGELGADVQVYRNDQISIEKIEALAPAHLVISPGPCTPNEAGVSIAAIEHFAGEAAFQVKRVDQHAVADAPARNAGAELRRGFGAVREPDDGRHVSGVGQSNHMSLQVDHAAPAPRASTRSRAFGSTTRAASSRA